MPHISTFVDRPIKIGARQIKRANVDFGAIGTTEHGTLNLAKGIGTISTVDIGSAMFSYGSAGTFASRITRTGYGSASGTQSAPFVRGRYGSFLGTVRAPVLRGAYGSHGTVAAPTHRGIHGSFAGTLTAPFVRGRYGSFSGTITTHRVIGSVGSFTRTVGVGPGTIASRIGSYGTIVAQFVRARYGSFSGTVKAPIVRGGYGSWGTVASAGIIRGGLGSFNRLRVPGTMAARVGSFGTYRGQLEIGRFGSYSGTVTSPVIRGRYGSFWGTLTVNGGLFRGRLGSFNRLVAGGTIRADVGTFGSVLSPLYRGRYGSFTGTLRAPNIHGYYGSFNRIAGTLKADHITHGTLAVPRIPLLQNLAGSLDMSNIGTLDIALKTYGTLTDTRLPGTFRPRTFLGRITGTFLRWNGASGSQAGTIESSIQRGTFTLRRLGSVGQVGTLVAWDVHSGRIPILGSITAPRAADKITTGTLASARHQLIQNLSGTIATDQYARDQQVGTWRGAYGSFGTLRGALIRGRYGSFRGVDGGGTVSSNLIRGLRFLGNSGSFLGTLVAPEIRGGHGSHGTLSASVVRGAYGSHGTTTSYTFRGVSGSFRGTFYSHRAIGSVGSYTRVAGAASNIVTLGTHLNGSWVGNEVRNRYAAWPTAFLNNRYRAWFAIQQGSIGSNFNVTSGRAYFQTGFTRRSPGSIKYWMGRIAGPDPSGTLRPFGTLFLYALAGTGA